MIKERLTNKGMHKGMFLDFLLSEGNLHFLPSQSAEMTKHTLVTAPSARKEFLCETTKVWLLVPSGGSTKSDERGMKPEVVCFKGETKAKLTPLRPIYVRLAKPFATAGVGTEAPG